jgi:adenosylcobinamide-GDP ribazoletransferase
MSERSDRIGGEAVAPERARAGINSPAALWSDLLSAVRAITILRLGAEGSAERMGRPALFYPAVGLAVGASLWVLDETLRLVVSQEITSVCLVAALAVASGGRDLDGFANTADGLIGFRGREWALAVMRDRRLGTFGAAAVFFLLILKVRSFDLLEDPARSLGILCAPMLGRWAMVVLAHGSREAGPPDTALRFASAVGFREFAMASVTCFLVALGLAQAVGLAALCLVGALAVALRVYFHHRLGGISEQSVGAVAEAAEALALVLFALLS